MEENIKEDTEEKKVRLKKEDIDFLYNKFIEITEDCVVKGYNIDNVQHEFGKLFLIKDSDTKLNLKPFDLEAAKSGKPVCTRDCHKARIICFDAKCGESTIIALIENGKNEEVHKFHKDGKLFGLDEDEESFKDLMMLTEKKERWINIYALNTCYSSKEEAEANIDKDYENEYIRTIKIEWEE